MSFQTDVEGLTSLSVGTTPTTTELSKFLKDGVIDVTSRWLLVRPQDIALFTRSSSESTSQGGLGNSDGKIISVVRESGTDADWRPCSAGSIGLQSDYADETSLHYASKINPKYVIGGDGSILVFPVPAVGGANSYKMYYVNSTPVNSSDAALIHSHTDINYFPLDKVYLVVLYAGIRSLQAKMGDTTITDLSVTAVPPDVPTLSSITFSSLDSAIDSSLTAIVAGDGTLGSSTLPTYTKPSITSRVAFADYWTVGDFGDNDPGSTVVTAVPPDSVVDTITDFSLSSDFTDAMANAETFFDDEDPEMVASAIQRAQTALQQSLNTFNTDMQKFQASGTGKFGADVAAYQAEVGAQVQEYTQKLQRYTTELGTVFQAWQKTESDSLQQYAADIQNELNEFNLENAKYQASMQEAMGEFQSQNQMNIANAERSQNRQLQNSINDMKAIFDNNAELIQKFGAEIQEYQAEVGTQIQEYTQNLQADGMGYQWLQGQYAALKAEYDQAFMIAAPKQQPQQQVRA